MGNKKEKKNTSNEGNKTDNLRAPQKWIAHSWFPLSYFVLLVGIGLMVFFGPLFWITIVFNIILIYLACFFLISYTEFEKEKKQEIKKWPFLSILIPAWNRGDSLRVCLQHVLAMEYPGKKEIYVIDDGSTDHTQQILNEFKGKFNVITNKKNKGKAQSLNDTLKIAKGEIVAIIDGDSYPQKDALLQMVPHMIHDQKLGAVTTVVRVQNSNGILQKIQELEYFLSFGLHNNVLSSHDGVYVTPGPFSLYLKKALEETGGYDTHNITEDMEITFHLHVLGYRIKVEPNARVYTDVPETLQGLWKQRKRWSYGSWQTMFKYRNKLFSKEKSFFWFFYPQRILLEGSSIIFLFMILRMVADTIASFGQTFYSVSTIGFEYVAMPAWVIGSSTVLYSFLIALWFILIALGIKLSGSRVRKLSIPGLAIFMGVYGIFIISVQAYSLARVVIGSKQAW